MNESKQQKRETFLERIAVMSENAAARGDCPTCFKAYDPRMPSCNSGHCIARWRARQNPSQEKQHG
jgi:hypothetical protein